MTGLTARVKEAKSGHLFPLCLFPRETRDVKAWDVQATGKRLVEIGREKRPRLLASLAKIAEMSENRVKSSQLLGGLSSSKKPKDWRKAIFVVREMKEHVYQTRGMACAVEVGSSVRLVTWRGVVDNADCNKVVMDRFAKKSTDVPKYRLQKLMGTTCGSFAFFSVSCSENFAFLQSKVPGSEIKASTLTAYSFSGGKTIELKFKYDESKKEYELTCDGLEKRVTEEVSLLGCPIIDKAADKERAVVGVVGRSDAGKIVPCFITEKEFDHENNATEEDEEKEKKIEGGCVADDNLDHQGYQTESENSTSSQKDMSSSGKDVLDAKFGSVQESSERVRSGAIPIEYLPYLALDIQSSKGRNSLGRTLGVDDSTLSGIDKDHDEDYERCYKMLKRWHQQSGTALFKDLAEALKECDLCDIATQYCYEENDLPTQKNQVVSGKLKAGRVSKDDLSRIAHAVKQSRKRLGRALGVSDDQIDTEVEEHRSDIYEQSYQILLKWVQKKGNQATYDALAQALLDRTVMMKSVMEKYCLAQ
ncbi:uncharacterized protein LOC110047308 isoform X2 [Orbicella faveolata]|uniref:uncharacterized protein LOC110047308 isoform X2 n=1 Tax=Orbicella faveolata TaxID=48498 RepID=UPI0009E5277E|nr:uncharacterized protein LOC110047308 isoform X2 [Orbicella faveolata]